MTDSSLMRLRRNLHPMVACCGLAYNRADRFPAELTSWQLFASGGQPNRASTDLTVPTHQNGHGASGHFLPHDRVQRSNRRSKQRGYRSMFRKHYVVVLALIAVTLVFATGSDAAQWGDLTGTAFSGTSFC